MTTKTQPVAATEPTPLSYVQSIGQKPYELRLVGPCNLVMNEAAVHIRAGYVPCPGRVPELLPLNGTMSLFLVLGAPDENAVTQAQRTSAEALQLQEAQYQRDVKAEAERIVEAEKQAALARQIDAQKREYAAAIKKLEAQMGAVGQ